MPRRRKTTRPLPKEAEVKLLAGLGTEEEVVIDLMGVTMSTWERCYKKIYNENKFTIFLDALQQVQQKVNEGNEDFIKLAYKTGTTKIADKEKNLANQMTIATNDIQVIPNQDPAHDLPFQTTTTEPTIDISNLPTEWSQGGEDN